MEKMPIKTGLKVLIGRSSQCDFTIENPESHGTVSGKHATIYQTEIEGTFILEDHSTNGTYVNGLLVHNAEHVIGLNENITLGRSYELDLANIISRYLVTSKTTKKKVERPQYVSPEPVREPIQEEPTRWSPDSSTEESALGTSNEPNTSSMEKIIYKIPSWYWILYVCTVAAAFFIGYGINC